MCALYILFELDRVAKTAAFRFCLLLGVGSAISKPFQKGRLGGGGGGLQSSILQAVTFGAINNQARLGASTILTDAGYL